MFIKQSAHDRIALTSFHEKDRVNAVIHPNNRVSSRRSAPERSADHNNTLGMVYRLRLHNYRSRSVFKR